MGKPNKLDKKDIEDIIALTPTQEGMLFHYLKDPGTSQYFEQLCLDISGAVDIELFERAWNFVIDTNEVLRTVFRWKKVEKPVQVVLSAHPVHLRYYDFSHQDSSKTTKQTDEILIRDRQETFDLSGVPFRVTLCKVGESTYKLIISNHHILYDGWSNGIILKEFFNAYDALVHKKTPQKPVKEAFKTFVKWINEREHPYHRKDQETFWRDYLEGFDTPTEFSVKVKQIKGKGPGRTERSKFTFHFNKDTREQLERFVRQHKVTVAALLYSAWGILLQKYNNSRDVLFGTTVSGRSASTQIKGIEHIVGLFINTLPLRVRTYPAQTAAHLIKQINETLQVREAYESTPLVKIKEYSQLSDTHELFDAIVAIENYPLDSSLNLGRNGPLKVNAYSMVEMTHYDLSLGIMLLDEIEINVVYNAAVFDEDIIINLSRHFQAIIERILENPGEEVTRLALLSSEERSKILYEFNDIEPDYDYPQGRAIHELFEEQAEKTPDHIAVIGQSAGEERSALCAVRSTLAYKELNQESDQLAHLLQTRGIKPESIVGILMERSIEIIIGILGILKAGAAYLPIDPCYPKERINYILEDSNTQLLLTQKALENKIEDIYETINLETPHLYTGDRKTPEKKSQPNHLAYVIYTSGSTGKPKGVLVNHRSAVNLLFALDNKYPCEAFDTYLLKTPHVFDVSITELFGWQMRGGQLAILPVNAEKDPKLIVDAIEREGVTHINFVPSMFNIFIKVLNPLNIRKISSLKYISLAGEALLPELVHKFRRLDTGIPLENIYGPTEGTVYSSKYSLSEWESSGMIPIGKSFQDMRVYILDKDDHLQPVGVPGELAITGTGLARGYLNQPGLTAEKFKGCRGLTVPTDKAKEKIDSNDRLYRTGDLCRWLADGNIEYLGRMDHQVKIRGYRIELGEIENQLLRHNQVKETVVVAKTDGKGDKYLCAYIVRAVNDKSTPHTGELREYLSHSLPEYMIPAYFVDIGAIPLTPTGKIDRRALPEPQLKSQSAYVAPRNKKENALVNIWSDVLGINKGQIGINDRFFELGGHSLKAVSLIGKIHKELDIELTIPEIFDILTVRQLAEFIGKKEETLYSPIDPLEKKEYYKLSSAQKRLFLLQQKEPGSTAYNITGMMSLEGNIREDKLEETFKKLIARHESLRTAFGHVNEEPVQRIYDQVAFKIEYFLATEGTLPIISNFVRPFDLSRPPLVRVGLVKVKENQYILMVDMHHMVSDGTSVDILTKEFMAFYAGSQLSLPGLRVQYKDFSHWQTDCLQSDRIIPQEAYWLKQFPTDEQIPVLQLPTDYQRPAEKHFEGNTTTFEIGREDTALLKLLTLKTETTLFMVLLAAFNVFISKLSGQEDIVVGTPVSGRQHSDLESIVGMFVNTLALRNYPVRRKIFLEFLREVKENFLRALENQDYQLEILVEKVDTARDSSRNPLFDMMLVLQNMETEVLDIPGLTLKPYHYESNTSKFDMTFTAEERTDEIYFAISYDTALFKKETVERFCVYFKKVLSDILKDANKELSDIKIITEEEQKQILYDFNPAEVPYPGEKTLHQLFEEQVQRTPDRIALVGTAAAGVQHAASSQQTVQMSYRQLNEKSNRLAKRLREKGVAPDSIVGLMAERSLEMIVGMLGILKAGGAYLPIAPDYPDKRKQYMLEDSGSSLLLTVGEIGEVTDYRADGKNPANINRSSDLAYTIYTSGSTGRPKGVLVEHGNAVNVVWWFGKTYHLGPGTHVMQMSDFTFDPSVNQIFGTLLQGAVLHLILKETLNDMELLRESIKKHGIHVVNFVPLLLYELLNAGAKLESIQVVLSGGERLDDFLKDHILEKGYELYNQYGPTETTIDALVEKCSKNRVTLGKPISNVRCYIEDNDNNLAPVGIPGELCISGAGVGRGYLNDPIKTVEKFTADPFVFGARMYKTGDRAKWLPHGNIDFLGRIDNQVKIRGFRIELQEIETQLLRIDEIKECVVIAIERNDARDKHEQYLCAYVVSDNTLDTSKLKEYLSRQLPDYMIPVSFVQMDRLPLTAIGKLDRKALPEPGIPKTAAAPKDEIEETLAEIWAQVLGIDKESIGMDANFFELGGHSLTVTIVASKIHQGFDIKIPLEEMFKRLTIRGLSEYIKGSAIEKFLPIEPVEKKQYYSLSSAQKRLHILQQMVPDSTSYNLPAVMELEGKLQRERLEEVLTKLINRHESLRTSFKMIEDEVVQKIHDDMEFTIEYDDPGYSPSPLEMKKMIQDFIRPFDLSQAPLLRAALVKIGDLRQLFMLDMPHIIVDGFSIEIFFKEFVALYEEKALSPVKIQYKDYSQWQNSEQQKEKMKSQEEYWLKRLAGELPVMKLPADFKRPPLQSFEGERLNFELSSQQLKRLNDIAAGEGATLFMTVLTIFNIFLSRITGQEDITIGTPIAGRRHGDLQHTIGMFVNMLVLRNAVAENQSFRKMLADVKECSLKAFENQDYLYEDLVEQLTLERDMSRNPLFDVAFDLQEIQREPMGIPGFKLKSYPYKSRISKFDLTLIGEERQDQLLFEFEYCTKLFKKETIERFSTYFKKIVSTILDQPDMMLWQMEILSEEEKQQILHHFSRLETGYPKNKTLHELFEEQAGRNPDHTALVCTAQGHLTYWELNKKTNQLAVLFREKGVKPNRIVGIMVERSEEMILGILGILKSGGTYLPIGPKSPTARKNYMLTDSGVKLLLTQPGLDKDITGTYQVIHLGTADEYNTGKEKQKTISTSTSNDFAYVIYTSGSTGNPKGVLITHSNLCPLLQWGYELGLHTNDRVIQNLSYFFDWSVWEIFITLTSGAGLYMVPEEVIMNPEACISFINKHAITVLHITPTQYQYLVHVGQSLETLRYLFIGAEKLNYNLVQQSFEWVNNQCRVFNMYGPTEATIISAVLEVHRSDYQKFHCLSSIPIGGPVGNTILLVLDKYMKLCPVKVAGELYIAGDGVAAGYLNNPALTAERFIVFHRSYRSYRSHIFYRTGDLVRWLSDGSIEFLGRLDHQVKIRGFRIELGEIESHLLSHKNIKEAIVIPRDDDKGDKQLCAYIVSSVHRPGDAALPVHVNPTELRNYLSKRLPDYMVPAHFVPLEEIPLNPNGKVNKKVLLEIELESEAGTYAAPRDVIDQKMVEIWSAVLGIKKDRVGIDDDFFQLGGHSLRATQLVSKIHKALNVKVSLTDIFEKPTVREMSDYIKTKGVTRNIYCAISEVEKKEYYELSPAQKRLFILDQVEGVINTAYNLPNAALIEGKPDKLRFEDAFHTLIKRHESFRTSFEVRSGKPVQIVHETVDFNIEYFTLDIQASQNQTSGPGQERQIKEIIAKFIRPFDLRKAPLLRAALVQLGKEKHVLLFDMHHIISDGVSMSIMVREFARLYKGETLPALSLQYKGFSEWQNRWLQESTEMKRQAAYWLNRFEGDIPVLNMPTDYPRAAVKSFEGENIILEINREWTGKIRQMMVETETTLFMVLLAIYNILLAKYTEQEDIIVGIPTAGRTHADLEHVIGMFVNTLAIRNYPNRKRTFADFLQEVKENTLKAYDNQDYPLDELVDTLGLSRTLNRNPLFDVLFVSEDTDIPTLELEDLTFAPYGFESSVSHLDLVLYITESHDTIGLILEYATALFKQTTAEEILKHYVEILKQVLEDREVKVKDIEISHDLLVPQADILKESQDDFVF